MRLRIGDRTYSPSEFLNTGMQVLYYEVMLPIMGLPSRLLFGNFVGFRNNIGPMVQIGINRLTAPKPAPTAKEKATVLNEHGYLLFPRSSQTADLDGIARSYNTHIASAQSALMGLGGKILYIHDPLAKIPELKSLVTAEIDAIARAYYGSSYRIDSVRAWRNYHIPTSRPEHDVGISNAFHQDGGRRNELRLFVLLSNGVTRESGATRFHDKIASARLARDPRFFSRRWQSDAIKRKLLDAKSLRYLEGGLGDACLINAQECLHASSIPQAGTYRDIVAFNMVPCRRSVKMGDIFEGMSEDSQITPKLMPFKAY
jgi:hypothetical protein